MAHNSSEILSETLHAFDKKSQSMYNFFGVLMKVHPRQIPHAIFEITRSGFIEIFHHCSVS